MERNIFVRLCGYNLKASDDIVAGAWCDCLVALVGTLVDYRGLEVRAEKARVVCESLRSSLTSFYWHNRLLLRDSLRSSQPFQTEKKAIECHRKARSGSGYDRDSLGVKFKKVRRGEDRKSREGISPLEASSQHHLSNFTVPFSSQNEGNGVFKCLWAWISNFARISMEGLAGGGIGLVLKGVLAEVNDDGPEDDRRLRGLRGSLEREIWKRRLALCRICDFFVASEVNTPGRLLVLSACVRGLLSNICGFVRGHLVDEVDELLKSKYIGLGVGVVVSAGAEIAVDDGVLNPTEDPRIKTVRSGEERRVNA